MKKHANLFYKTRQKLKAYITDSYVSILIRALVIKSLYYVNGSMRGSRRNKIRPRGNPAIVRSIPAVLFPQHSYPHPRIPAVPIPVHTSRLNLSVAGCTWKRLRVVTIRRHLHKSYRGADRSGPAAVCVCRRSALTKVSS